MFRTITVIVSTFFAVIFFVLVMIMVPKTLNRPEAELGITSLQARPNGRDGIVSWETSTETNGAVYYKAAGKDIAKRDHDFQRFHRIVLVNITGRIPFTAESCDITGNCMTKGGNVTV
jgi:hypothetical protein